MISRKTMFCFAIGVFFSGLSAGEIWAQEPETETVAQVKPSAAHDIAGKENCMMCHAIGATPVLDVPASHDGRANETCMWCHAADSPMLTVQPTNTPHPKATEETDCMRCHGPGANPDIVEVSATHDGRANKTCMWCHVKVAGGGGGR